MYAELDSLTNSQLAAQSAVEQREFSQGKAGTQPASLKLFWRAIMRQEEDAWALIYQQWSGRLMRWFLQHPLHELALKEADADSYLTGALSKFWQGTSSSERVKTAFPTLSELLAYLRCCLNSAILDGVRQANARRFEVDASQKAETLLFDDPELSDEALWKSIERALPERRERLLIFLRYVQGDLPREIALRYPEEFANATEVYRMERNILGRLRRHPALALWKDMDW